MSMTRCNNGHFYDSTKHSSCPHCGVQGLDIDPTRAAKKTTGGSKGDSSKGDDEKTRPQQDIPRHQVSAREEGATVALVRKKTGTDPVVGWLVCVEGPDKGRDYRIRMERNFIGRSPSMDIAIIGDDTISRENHAVVSFNPRKSSFLLSVGDGRGMVYLNDDEVAAPSELKAYDRIELGRTTLTFVPFCGEQFKWELTERAPTNQNT